MTSSLTLYSGAIIENLSNVDERCRMLVNINRDGKKEECFIKAMYISLAHQTRTLKYFRTASRKPMRLELTDHDLVAIKEMFTDELAIIRYQMKEAKKLENRIKGVQKAKETKQAKHTAQLLGLPAIRGSQKQIAWAEKIRVAYFESTPVDKINEEALSATSADFWIDNYKNVLRDDFS